MIFVAGTIAFMSFGKPAKDDEFADALRLEAYNGLNRTRKAIRYGVKYLDAFGQRDINDSTICVSPYITVNVTDIIDKDMVDELYPQAENFVNEIAELLKI